MSNRWLWFMKYILIPITAMLAGYGIAIWQMVGK